MPILLIQVTSLVANFIVFIFAGFYILRLRNKEKELQTKETKVDTDYHRVVDDALTKEKKILDDASSQADRIIAGAQFVNNTTQASVNQSLQNVATEVQKEATDASRAFMESYKESLKQIVGQSLTDFQNLTKGLETDLHQQIQDFHNTVLPNIKVEIEEYKKNRMQEIDRDAIKVIQKVAQEILNKSISVNDHEKLLADSLEKAKREGIFE